MRSRVWESKRMRLRVLFATVLNWLVVAVVFGTGVHYLASAEIMPYHQEIVEVPWAELTPGCRTLILALLKGTGMVGVTAGVALAVLLAIPFRRREGWSRWAILVIGATVLVPMLLGAVRLRVETGAGCPWWASAALLAILCLGFWLSRDFQRTA